MEITKEDKDKRIKYICEHIIENEDIINDNLTIWNPKRDKLLMQLVIMLNFNFKEISKRFDKLCKIKHPSPEKDGDIVLFSITELRRHYSFLHAMRYLNKTVDEVYYKDLKKENIKKKTEIKNEEIINKLSIPKDLNFNDYLNHLLTKKVDKEELNKYEKEINNNTNNNFPIDTETVDINNNINENEKEEEILKERIEQRKKALEADDYY